MGGGSDRIQVLCVDDDPKTLDTVTAFLEREDERLETVAATDAAEALDRLDGSVDCVVSDYDMPGMDGIALLQRVREADEEIPFILFTAKGDESVAGEAVTAGATGYLRKGTGADQFTRLANRVVNAAETYRARREVRETRERFRKLLSDSADYIHVVTPDGTIQYITPSVERVLGYDPDSLVGENVLGYLHPEDRGSVAEGVEEILADPDSEVTVEGRAQHRDGSWRWIEAKSRNLLEDPTIGGIVTNARDVTERRDRQRRLERQNDRLERFAGLISHDLRNPLNVATGRLELVADDCDHPQIEAVSESLDRMERLIDGLVTLARADLEPEQPERTDLAATVEHCWANVATGGAVLTVDTDRTVLAEPARLERLLENLLRNSVEHGVTGAPSGDRGGSDPTAAVSVTVGDRPDGFYVADDGPGIPPDERERVFDLGYTTTEDGSGLGLHIVRQIAEAHGWTVTATGSEAGGARFEFTGVTTGE
jgi:PAS domain S-box-containing protein